MMERSSISLTPSERAVWVTFSRKSLSLQLAIEVFENNENIVKSIEVTRSLGLSRFTVVNLRNISISSLSTFQLNHDRNNAFDVLKNLWPFHTKVGLHDHEG